MCSSVDLPLPDGPWMAMVSPCLMVMSTFFKAATSFGLPGLYSFVIPLHTHSSIYSASLMQSAGFVLSIFNWNPSVEIR